MSSSAIRVFGTAVAERVIGHGPGRPRALAAAAVAGTVTAVATYRLLRSNAD